MLKFGKKKSVAKRLKQKVISTTYDAMSKPQWLGVSAIIKASIVISGIYATAKDYLYRNLSMFRVGD